MKKSSPNGTVISICNYVCYEDCDEPVIKNCNSELVHQRDTESTVTVQELECNNDNNEINTVDDSLKGKILNETDEVINYLNTKTGSSYRHTSANRQPISEILIEDYSVQDCKLVIDYKYADWWEDEIMVQYLRPITLFQGKFESYLSAGKEWDKKGRKRLHPVKPAEIPWGN